MSEKQFKVDDLLHAGISRIKKRPTMIEMRECHCGGIPKIITWSDSYDIECQSCGITLAGYDNEDELIADWNHRPTEDALRAENERLKNELADAHKQYARVEEVYAKNQCLQIRVGELEGIIKEFLGASYIYESENGEPTNKHKDLVRRAEALTPPATEKEGE